MSKTVFVFTIITIFSIIVSNYLIPEVNANEQLSVDSDKQKIDLYIVQHGPIKEFTYLDGYQNVNTGIAGDIVNLSDKTLMNIVISVKTFKNGESFQDTTSWYPIKRILRAGEASPFAIHPASGFDSYEIWIENYQLSQIEPTDPFTKMNGFELKKNIQGTYFFTIPCNTDLDEGLILLIVGYDKDNQIIDLDYQTLDLPDEDDCKLYGGKTSLLQYWGLDQYLGGQAKDMSKRKFSEFFIMKNLEGIITNYQGKHWYITSPPANPENDFTLYDTNVLNQISVYSKYFPNSLLPRHMDLNEIRIIAEEHGKMNWVYENKPVEVFDNEWMVIDSLNSMGIYYSNSGQYWEAITWFDTTLEHDPENLIALYNKGLALGVVGRTDEAAIYFDKVVKLESSIQIPDWIRNNADWWTQGLISDDDFVKGIQYLVEQGIMEV